MDEPIATVRKVDGQLVLDDPVAVEVIKAVAKHNCRNTLDLNAERVIHFNRRIKELHLSAVEFVIVIINVDDVHGRPLADALMPGYDWQQFRNRGEVPFARGLAEREGVQEFLAAFDEQAVEKLRKMKVDVAVVVIDHGVAEVFPVCA